MIEMVEREKVVFKPNSIFEYNNLRKELLGIIEIIIYVFLGLFLLSYFVFFKESNLFIFQWIRGILTFIQTITIQNSVTILETFYTALLGGLFFIFLPNELLFIKFLKNHNPLILLIFFMVGLSLSYWADYFIGLKFAKLVKHIIGAKNFHKTKGIINKYGKTGIFLFNLLPFPSQQLTAILGTFKYNKARFYSLFLAGQLTKYVVIIFAISLF